MNVSEAAIGLIREIVALVQLHEAGAITTKDVAQTLERMNAALTVDDAAAKVALDDKFPGGLMDWHELGAEGDYPIAVRKLIGFSGVYAIRERGFFGNTIVYVGESHTGRLYKTLTRHFQQWSRGKKFWRGVYQPDQTDPGHTYVRGNCDVAFETVTAKRAPILQAEWIERLRPRDNRAEVEEVPF